MNQCLSDLSYSHQCLCAVAKVARTHTVNHVVFLPRPFDFIIIALVIFMPVKELDWFKKQGPPAPPAG